MTNYFSHDILLKLALFNAIIFHEKPILSSLSCCVSPRVRQELSRIYGLCFVAVCSQGSGQLPTVQASPGEARQQTTCQEETVGHPTG